MKEQHCTAPVPIGTGCATNRAMECQAPRWFAFPQSGQPLEHMRPRYALPKAARLIAPRPRPTYAVSTSDSTGSTKSDNKAGSARALICLSS